MDNVINFPSRKKKISEEEINLLLKGLLKLVKKSAIEEMSDNLKKECEFATKSVVKLNAEVISKDKEISRLRAEVEELKLRLNPKAESIIIKSKKC